MLGIRVVSLAGVTPPIPMVAVFGPAGGDIGRGADCKLVLADPERRISRHQVRIDYRAGRHFIRQTGTNLVVEVDDVPLAPNVEWPLDPGARIRIGAYMLKAEPVTAPLPAQQAAPAPQTSTDELLAPFAPKPGKPPRASVFVDLLGTPDNAAPTALAPAQAAPAAASSMELDLVVGYPTGAQERPVLHPPAAPAPPQAGDPSDPYAALFAGLGLPPPVPQERSAEQLWLVGAMLRRAVEGALELLSARAIAKRELGANPTLLQPRENNPLKFSPDADAALAHLLGPAKRGFIAPLAALSDAFDDLRAHELAVLAGTRAALEEVLAHFEPSALEHRLVRTGMWDKLLAGSRDARLWAHYRTHHADIVREIGDNFDSLFGRAFRLAYEAQLDALAGGAGQGAPDARENGAPPDPHRKGTP